ncbi:30S ribosomal protein S7 [Patescibacteria group bacterium]|nr:30S ribosomal protein S7 [Patescibacteria group bacterium]
MRGKRAPRRKIDGDIKFNNVVIERFINNVMKNGKKSVARDIVYKAIEKSSSDLNIPPVELFDKVIENVSPSIEVRSRRVGGASFQVPTPISEERQLILAIRWIINAARNKKGHNMIENLSGEMINAYNNTGDAIKKKTDVEKMAEANKAFSHLA